MAIASKPKVRTDLDVIELDDELVLYDPVRDQVHYLSATAALVFQLCDGSATVRELATDIAQALGAPEKRIERQVRTLLKDLRDVGLLEGSLTLKAAAAPDAAKSGSEAGEHHEHEHEHDQREQVREQKTENAWLDKLDHLGWVVQQSYSFHGHLVGIRTTSHAFASWLEETLADYKVDAEAQNHYSVVVEEGEPKRKGERRYHILYRGTIAVARTLDLSLLARMLLSALEVSMLDDREDLIFLEAVPVSSNGVNVLVPAILISYVASLGRRIQRLGLALPANAFVAVDSERGVVVPSPNVLVDVDEALSRLGEIAPANGERDERLIIDRPWPIDVVCSVGQGDPGTVELVSRATALHRLTNYVVNLKKLQGSAVHGLERLVSGAECRQVSAANPKDIVDAIVAEARTLDGA